jgi:hypothetical protein
MSFARIKPRVIWCHERQCWALCSWVQRMEYAMLYCEIRSAKTIRGLRPSFWQRLRGRP